MIKHKYGAFQDAQFNEYLKQLHKKIHWLLIYKDPKLQNNFPEMTKETFDKYFENIMFEINGLNALLSYPTQICDIMCLLQSAYLSTLNENFDFQFYRKAILDSHTLVDKIKNQGGDSDDKL